MLVARQSKKIAATSEDFVNMARRLRSHIKCKFTVKKRKKKSEEFRASSDELDGNASHLGADVAPEGDVMDIKALFYDFEVSNLFHMPSKPSIPQ